MMQTQRDIASFVLRLTQDFWRDSLGEPHVQWRGHIRHVQGDSETAFADFSEAIAFIQQHLAKLTANALPGGSPMEQDKLMRESFKLWQQFAATYNDMMFAAMENALKQSDAIKHQMDEAVAKSLQAWKVPDQADEGQLAAAVQSLQAQVQALAEKVERLEQSLKAKEA